MGVRRLIIKIWIMENTEAKESAECNTKVTVQRLTSPSKAQEVRAARPSTSTKVHTQKELD